MFTIKEFLGMDLIPWYKNLTSAEIPGERPIEHVSVNDLPLGRNVEEVLRVVKALQFTEKYGEVCPANWQDGSEGLKPTAVGVADYLAKHEK